MDDDARVGVAPAERPQAVVGDGEQRAGTPPSLSSGGRGRPSAAAGRRRAGGPTSTRPRPPGRAPARRPRSSATPSSTAASGTRSGRSARSSGRGPWRRRPGRRRRPRRSRRRASSGGRATCRCSGGDRRLGRVRPARRVAIGSACGRRRPPRLESGWRCGGDRPASAVGVVVVVAEEVEHHALLADRLAAAADPRSCGAAGRRSRRGRPTRSSPRAAGRPRRSLRS